MATVAEVLRKSTINIQNITQTLSETKKSTSAVNNSVENISRIVATNTRIKRELFARSDILNSRREEASKRQELEDQIESTKVSTSPQAGLAFASRSEKGPLERLLGFLGFTFAGWILENLPTWIFMGQEFMSRINSFGRSMYNMVYNMQNIIKYFGDTLKYSFDAIIRLDFDEFVGEGTVAKSFEELNLAVQDLGTNITDTFKLFTTPLTESLETGEQAPGLGETRPDTMFPGVQQETGGYVTAGLSGVSKQRIGGDTAFLSEVKRVSQKYGIKEGDLLGLIASESGFNPAAGEIGGHVGLIQFSVASAKSVGTTQDALKKMTRAEQMKYVDKYFENWNLKKGASAGQLYATVFAPAYASGDPNKVLYSSPSIEYRSNAPLDSNRDGKITVAEMGGRIERKKKEFGISDNISITSLPGSSISQPQTKNLSGYRVTRNGRNITSLGQLPPHHGSSRTTYGGNRLRQDFTLYKGNQFLNVPVPSPVSGTVNFAGNAGAGGKWVEIQSSQGLVELGHFNSLSVKSGDKVSMGTILGLQGYTGRVSPSGVNGTHVHIQAPDAVIANYISMLSSGKIPYTPVERREAQISAQPKLSQPSAMTPERKGSQILFIDDTRPQVPQTSYPSQQPSVTPTVTEFKMLNNFIKNKLLIDLAYL